MSERDDIQWQWHGFLPRSYLFSTATVPKPSGLREIPLPEGHLFVSPDYTCAVGQVGASFVALIGHCIDLRRPDADERYIATSLAGIAVRDGFDAMLADTDDLLGRFAAICRIGGRWHVFNDASAMRTVYYAEDRPAIASHSTLLGELIGAQPRMEIFRHYWCALPGNASPVPGVRVLPANFELDIETRGLRRYWPRAARRERPVAALADELDTLFSRAADAIAIRWTPAISMTAGLDSRFTLAVFRHTSNITTFTYDRGEQDAVDLALARQVCARLNIPHNRLPAVGRSRAQSVYRLIESMPDCSFDQTVAAIYLSTFQGDRHIHVRSNLAEIGRAFWRKHPGMPTTLDPANWVGVSMSKWTAHLPGREAAAALMGVEMPRFFAAVGYDQPTIHGYDVWDLVYMEHRMATWHGQALLGSDPAFDTAILFNARRILDLMLAAPLAERKNATLLRRIIAKRAPELADIPVNPRPPRTISQLFAGAYRRLKRHVPLVRTLDQKLVRRRAPV